MKKLLLSSLFAFLFAGGLFAQGAVKKVCLEEFTGAWCGYCPDGAVIMEDIIANYPEKVIGISLHNGDGMVTAVGNQVINFYTIGYPSGVIDRMQAQGAGLNRGEWNSKVSSRLAGAAKASISLENASFDAPTNILSIDVRITFLENMSGKFRPNLLLTQDNVSGSGSGYDQSNYMNNTPGHPYYGAGNPIVGYDHMHVLRAIAGSSAWGLNGQITDDPTSGSEFVIPYQIFVYPTWDKSEMQIIATVNRFDGSGAGQREILNAEEISWSLATENVHETGVVAKLFEAYPNPFADRLTISFDLGQTSNLNLSVYNAMGQKINTLAAGIMNTGLHSMFWAGDNEHGEKLANGTYFAVLALDNGVTVSKKVVLYR